MPVFDTEFLTRTTADIFTAAGMRPDEATVVGSLLVEANCAGHDSHGVIRIPQYLGQIEAGGIAPGGDVPVDERIKRHERAAGRPLRHGISVEIDHIGRHPTRDTDQKSGGIGYLITCGCLTRDHLVNGLA